MSLLVVVALFATTSFSQSSAYLSVKDPEEIPWRQIHDPSKRFSIAGEAHQVSIVHPFHLSHVRYLVSEGVRNIVLEYPYSYALFANEYIQTGNDSILRNFVSGYAESILYWKGIYELNRSLPAHDKIRVWGIDHELGGGWRTAQFKRAVLFIMERNSQMPPSLSLLISDLKQTVSNDSIRKIKDRLRSLQNDPSVALFLGERYNDFKILTNRLDHYKVNRNDEMLEAFIEIWNTFKLDSDDRFIGQFGWGHIDKNYKRSMSYLLENHPGSPVRHSTFVIGVQYLNCFASLPGSVKHLDNDGIVSNHWEKRLLKKWSDSDPQPIKILIPSSEGLQHWKKSADILFVFSGFPGMTKN